MFNEFSANIKMEEALRAAEEYRISRIAFGGQKTDLEKCIVRFSKRLRFNQVVKSLSTFRNWATAYKQNR
jgi:hypothetical protein